MYQFSIKIFYIISHNSLTSLEELSFALVDFVIVPKDRLVVIPMLAKRQELKIKPKFLGAG